MIGPLGAVGSVAPAGTSGGRLVRVSPASRVGAVARAAAPTNAVLTGRIDLTEAIAIVRVRPDDGPRDFVPGQYFGLGLATGGALVRRPYSTASAPGSAELEFLIRRVKDGRLTTELWTTPVGTRVWLGPAKGTFTRRTLDGRRPILVATGTGLAPFVAMLRADAPASDRPGAVVVHGVAHVPELAFRTELTDLASDGRIAYLPTISRPTGPADAGWSGAVGRVTDTLGSAALAGLFDPADSIAYLCGNPGMIASTTEALAGLGLAADAIVTERYWDAAER